MKYIDINKRYTEIVTEYLTKGYNINTRSMCGSQGDYAHIDLTDGTEVIRIMVDTFHDWTDICLDGLEIIVGRANNEAAPELGMDNACIRLTLASGHSTFPVCLPDWNGKLEMAKRVLKLDDLADAAVRKTEFRPSMSELERLLPLDSVTAGDANDLACILGQIEQAGDLKKFYCALSAICPDTFAEAIDIAADIDGYEIVPEDMDEYGRQVLRRIGADDELLDTIDGYMDFSALGEDSMSEDGVRRTEYGLFRRLSEPFPPEQQAGMNMV